MTLNREDLVERMGHVPPAKMTEVDSGLRLALALG